ncbi:MAG TPA: lipopolysaccharide kinase InaA family protein [Longimicrobium sp.]|nr:lipopolysaccharide kinase InaA family protein [Longimicrobium sp.]
MTSTSETPEGLNDFVPMEDGRTRLLVRRGWEDAAAVIANAEREGLPTVAGGREEHPVVELPDGRRAVIRRYRRGGMVRHFNRDLYFGGNRAFDELRATEHARAGGVRVPLVIAAMERPARVAGYRARLATVLVPDACDAAAFLAVAPDAGERREVLREAGRQIGLMHEAGVAHPDVNLRNLLVAEEGGARTVYLLDFDRARVLGEPLSRTRRERDLRRLARSARKLGAPIDPDDWAALRDGYGDGWPAGVDLSGEEKKGNRKGDAGDADRPDIGGEREED